MRPSIRAPRLSGIPRICLRCRDQAQRRYASAIPAATTTTIPQPARARRTTAAAAAATPPSLLLSSRPFSSSTTAAAASEAPSKPEPPQTHYDLFPETLPSGPPPNGPFPIDTRALRREFLRLQAAHHPDFHQHRPELRARAEAASSLINDAYRTLANPLLRAQYLLSLRGVDVAQDETLKVEEPDLLMLVLEAREEIEEAEEERDLEEPRRVNDERIAETERALDGAFARDDLEAAKREAVRMRYWVNIKDSLDNWERGKPVVLQH